MAVMIPHTFANRSGFVPASELDDDFNALAAAINVVPAVLNVSPTAGAADNRAAIQAAHDALPAAGGILWQTVYGVHIDAAINITKPVLYLGPGTTQVTTPGTFALYLDTVGQTGFNATGKGPFNLQNLSVFGAGSTSHVLINGPTGALKGTWWVGIENCVFYAGLRHIDIASAIGFRIKSCTFWNYTECGVRVRNTNDGDQGDSLIGSNCVFQTSAGSTFGVCYNSGGGLKILGNKFLGSDYGIAVDPTTTATDPLTISDLIIANNSIEQFGIAGIFLTRVAGALVPTQIQILGNQIAALAGGGAFFIEISPGGARGADYAGGRTEGNYFAATPAV